jgi:hypothetical protein
MVREKDASQDLTRRSFLKKAGVGASLIGASLVIGDKFGGAMSSSYSNLPSRTLGPVGTSGTQWNLIQGLRIISVTLNGPTDGGNYGPNTANTTTSGIQEAINDVQAAGGGIVWLDPLLVINLPYAVSVTISKSYLTLKSELTFNSSTDIPKNLLNLTIDSSNNAVLKCKVEGMPLGTLLFNSGGGNTCSEMAFRDNFINNLETKGYLVVDISFSDCYFLNIQRNTGNLCSFGAVDTEMQFIDCTFYNISYSDNQILNMWSQIGSEIILLGSGNRGLFNGSNSGVTCQFFHIDSGISSGVQRTFVNLANSYFEEDIPNSNLCFVNMPQLGGNAVAMTSLFFDTILCLPQSFGFDVSIYNIQNGTGHWQSGSSGGTNECKITGTFPVMPQNYSLGNVPTVASGQAGLVVGRTNVTAYNFSWLAPPGIPSIGPSKAVQNKYTVPVIINLAQGSLPNSYGTHVVDNLGHDNALLDEGNFVLYPGEKVYFATAQPPAWSWKCGTAC